MGQVLNGTVGIVRRFNLFAERYDEVRLSDQWLFNLGFLAVDLIAATPSLRMSRSQGATAASRIATCGHAIDVSARRGNGDGDRDETETENETEKAGDQAESSDVQYTFMHRQTFEDDELASVVAVDGSADGQFLYTSAFANGAVCQFGIDQETGLLTKVATSATLQSAVGLAVSPDQKMAAICAHRKRVIVLCERDAESGELEWLDEYKVEEAPEEGLGFPIAVAFSKDSKFVVASDVYGALIVLEVDDESLKLADVCVGDGADIAGTRMLTFDPSGKFLLVACITSNSVAVFEMSPDDGKLSHVCSVEDESGDATALGGAHGICCSPDGKHVYIASGRFNGDSSVTALELSEEGQLKFIQQLENGEELENFVGGNWIQCAPDGKHVYASGARSGNFACFRREPSTGKLTFQSYFSIEDDEDLGMTSGLFVSKDSRFVYVGGEGEACLYVFERVPHCWCFCECKAP